MLIRLLLALASILWINHSSANFAAWDREEEGPWLMQESEHFVITYPAKNSALAGKSLNIAERVHQELLPFFGASPSEKTQMVLVDDFDVSNGWATFFPFAQIRLYTSPPDTISGLEESDDWLHTLIRHEYVHILHMEMAAASPDFLQNIFGRLVVLFPHTMTPSFMLEGLATYLETNEELAYGRLQSAYYAMQMRMEVASGSLKDLEDVSAPLRDWPLGMQYLYGSYFYQFLAETYSEEKIKQYLQNYSRQIIPAILQNSVAYKTFGKDFPDLWLEYQAWLNAKFEPQIASLQQEQDLIDVAAIRGVVTNYQTTAEALFQDVSSSQGSDFYFIANSGEDSTQLKRSSTTDSLEQSDTLVKTRDVIALDVNEQGDIAASRLINWVDGRSWADVYLLQDGNWQALTQKQRLRNVRWLNNNWMIASRKQFGISQLILLNKEGEQKILWQGDDEKSVIGDYDIADNGEYLIAAMKRSNQGWNLERLDLTELDLTEEGNNVIASLTWQMITKTRSVESCPQILADGRILFSADYNDVYNLYVLDPVTKNLQQLTHMLGGAFAPKLVLSVESTQADSIVFQAYTSEGFEFRKIEFESKIVGSDTDDEKKSPQLQYSAPQYSKLEGQLNYPDPYVVDVAKTAAQDYQPWSTLTPTWWLPYYQKTPEYTQIGLMTAGADALTRHLYSAQIGIDTDYKLADMNFTYAYDNRYQVSFNRSHDYIDVGITGENDDGVDYIIEKDQWLFSRLNIVNAIEDQLSLNAAIIVQQEASLDRDDLFKPLCLDGNFNQHKSCEKSLVGLGLRFDNRENYLNSPGNSYGRYLDLVIETNELLDSDYEGEVIQAQWLEIFDLPGRRSLSLQTLWGMTDQKGEKFTLGGEDRGSESSLFGRDDFALRGYAPSSTGGQYYNVNRINFTQWLARVEKGWKNYPLALGDISSKFFIDYGSAWQDDTQADYLTGAGIELNAEVLVFYNLLLPISLTYAHGFDETLGQDRFTFGVSLPY